MENDTILIIDDDKMFLELMQLDPDAKRYDIRYLSSGKEALEVLESTPVDLVITDILMPEMSGKELFEVIQDRYPDIPVILITALFSVEDAVDLVKRGAFHYFKKPIDENQELFWTTVREALNKRKQEREFTRLQKANELSTKRDEPIIGESKGLRNVLENIARFAPLDETILISGETGTGKDLVAKTIHFNSGRRDGPFIALNCSEFSSGILESELFGHIDGLLPVAGEIESAWSKPPTRALCFSTRSRTHPWSFRPSCFGSCRTSISDVWGITGY